MKSFLPKSSIFQLSGFIISITFLLCVSCRKEDFDPDKFQTPDWHPQVALPLVYSILDIQDMAGINDSAVTLETDANQFCTIVYEGRIFELPATDLVSFTDQSYQNSISLNNNQILTLTANGQVTFSGTQLLDFSMSQGIEIDSINLKAGSLMMNFSSDFRNNINIQLTIPEMISPAGQVYTAIIPMQYNGTIPVTHQINVPLSGYEFDMTDGGTIHNRLRINYQVTVMGSAAGITSGNSISWNTSFSDIRYNTVYGYIGQQNFTGLRDSVEISMFGNSVGSGTFTIADPLITFDISNSIGIPFSAHLTQLVAMNANLTDFTVANGIPDPLPVLSPTINQAGQTIHSAFTLHRNNSNMVALIAQQPKFLISQTQLSTNPSGVSINFLQDTARIAVDMHCELPLFGTAKDFTINDTVPFSYSDLNNVEELTLRVDIENGFPLEAGVELVFLDKNFNPVDTIFTGTETIIQSGTVDATSGRVTAPGKKIVDRLFERSRINKILSAENILVKAIATSTNNGNTNVRIYSDYQLKVKVGAIAILTIH